MSEITENNAESFAARLPLYHGPLVKIRVRDTCEYEISKALLCAESPVFTAMFGGSFREAQENAVDLELMEGVISKRSLEALFQWLYLRIVKFNIENPGEHISAAIELARLADRYGITGIESQTAEYIKEIILDYPDPEYEMNPRDMLYNESFLLRPEHIISGTLLHDGHPVRCALAGACVADFLQNHPHKFADTAQEYPEFAADLLHETAFLFGVNHETTIELHHGASRTEFDFVQRRWQLCGGIFLGDLGQDYYGCTSLVESLWNHIDIK